MLHKHTRQTKPSCVFYRSFAIIFTDQNKIPSGRLMSFYHNHLPIELILKCIER